MRELNKLTKHLLSLGYTKENPPDEYRSWNDFYGGWEYSAKQERNMVVEAPCGVVSNASHIVGSMGYQGIDWCLENDNAVMRCPFKKMNCEKNNRILWDCVIDDTPYCEVKITDRAFDYELSAEKIEERNRQDHEEAIKAFARTQERFCKKHLCYDRYTNKFWIDFNPFECGGCNYCTMIQRRLDGPKGNVFYDLKISRLVKGFGFIPDEWKTEIIKGNRLFVKNKPLIWCELCARPEYLKHIDYKIKTKYFTELHFAKHHGRGFQYEILNVRAEKRESRDLDQDLEDIKNGMTVRHKSDELTAAKEAKRERAKKAKENRIRRLLKLCQKCGYDNLTDIEQLRIERAVDKGLLSWKEIRNVEKTKEDTPEQLSLF